MWNRIVGLHQCRKNPVADEIGPICQPDAFVLGQKEPIGGEAGDFGAAEVEVVVAGGGEEFGAGPAGGVGAVVFPKGG